MSESRCVGLKDQGRNEQIAYSFDFSDDGTPSNPAVALYLNGEDVSAACMPGVPVISGMHVITPAVMSLTPGKQYRLECRATISGNVFEPYLLINAEI